MKKLKIVMIGMLVALVLLSGCITTTINGRHSGQITAVEKSGLIWKTYQVFIKTDISSSQEEAYCVDDASLIPDLERVSKERKKITLLYKDEVIVAPWRCANTEVGIVTGLEEEK